MFAIKNSNKLVNLERRILEILRIIHDMKKINVMLVFGTRPEAIKMCPLVKVLKERGDFDVHVCVTGQHKEMLKQILEIFQVNPDFDLNIMKQGQTLFDITNCILTKLKPILEDVNPDIVLVHGDTSTTFATALACFFFFFLFKYTYWTCRGRIANLQSKISLSRRV